MCVVGHLSSASVSVDSDLVKIKVEAAAFRAMEAAAEVTELLRLWEEHHQTPNYDPVPHLTRFTIVTLAPHNLEYYFCGCNPPFFVSAPRFVRFPRSMLTFELFDVAAVNFGATCMYCAFLSFVDVSFSGSPKSSKRRRRIS